MITPSSSTAIRTSAERMFTKIRVDLIDVVNSRNRGKQQFQSNVRSIADNGLYKPIMVNAIEFDTTGRYQLICGEGRLLVHQELKRDLIMAEVVNVPLAIAHMMSLGENLTKCPPKVVEYAYALLEMHQKGASDDELARITGHSAQYVRSYLTLVQRGEERLIKGVEQGLFPLDFASKVANSPDGAIQHILMDAYDQKFITAKHVDLVRKILMDRMRQGAEQESGTKRLKPEVVTADTLKRDIANITREKERWVKEVEGRETRLFRLLGILQKLYGDEAFRALLQKHQLGEMPILQGTYGT